MDYRQQSISVTLRKKQPFVLIPWTVARCPWLAPTHKLLLIVLWSHCDFDGLNGCVSYSRLAHDSRLNERTVARLLKDLQSLNVISITQKSFPSGQTRPHYTIHNDIFDSFKNFSKPVEKPAGVVGIKPTPPVGIKPRGGGQILQKGVGIKPTHLTVLDSSSEFMNCSSKDEDSQTDERNIHFLDSEEEADKAALRAALSDIGVSQNTINNLLEKYPVSTLNEAYYRSKGQGQNPAGYFIAVLKSITK